MTLTLLQRTIALLKNLHDALSSCSLWSVENETIYLSVLSSLEAEVKRMEPKECQYCRPDGTMITIAPDTGVVCPHCKGSHIILDDEGGEGEEE